MAREKCHPGCRIMPLKRSKDEFSALPKLGPSEIKFSQLRIKYCIVRLKYSSLVPYLTLLHLIGAAAH